MNAAFGAEAASLTLPVSKRRPRRLTGPQIQSPGCRSLDLQAERIHPLAPLCHIVLEALAGCGLIAGHRIEAECGKPLPEIRLLHNRIDGAVQRRNDRGRCLARDEQPDP